MPGEQLNEAPEEHVDVLILGAGLSGVGAACHLRRLCPEKTFLLLEARHAIGGTWDLFRYPGIRSDSDMFTLGYSFKPWHDPQPIADGPTILDYIRRAAREFGVDDRVRFGLRAIRAEWSTEHACWTVHAQHGDTGRVVAVNCDFLYCCTGYYNYDEGYRPPFEGIKDFEGRVVHPQRWPGDLDYAGKRVVVIGSGATAITLVPAMAEQAAHVTMLQRSPSYVVSVPRHDPFAEWALLTLDPDLGYALLRWKNVLLTMLNFYMSRRAPGLTRRLIRSLVSRQLPAGYEIDPHFTPTYNPWDQRLCLVPDGDLFKTLSSGRASIVTGEIDRFTESGVRLRTGEELGAEIVVSATGLNMLMLGGLELIVDGDGPLDPGKMVAYKGMMLCGVPNLALSLGYTNASWTLKADLVAEYVCRLLTHMAGTGVSICTPQPPPERMARTPLIDFKSGYVLRSLARLPKQGAKPPWRLHQNYIKDVRLFRRGPIDDAMLFTSPQPTAASGDRRHWQSRYGAHPPFTTART